MNEQQKIPLPKLILAILVVCVLIYLLVKSFISAKRTEDDPETTPTEAGTENNRESTVDSGGYDPVSASPEPETHFPVILDAVIPLRKDAPQFPARRKRKRITRENMETIFRHGSRKLNLTNAVAELKSLGFGKSAAYEALSDNGQFSAWLQFSSDGIITWH